MTEAEWLGATNPLLLLRYLRGPDDARCMRFYACACCRFVFDLLVDPRSRHALETVELFLIGESTAGDLVSANVDLRHARWATYQTVIASPSGSDGEFAALGESQAATAVCIAVRGYNGSLHAKVRDARVFASAGKGDDAIRGLVANMWQACSTMLRDIYGNPFRVGRFDPSWRTSSALGLARSMFLDLDFSNMPILADALEDAGCDDAEMLAHCRGPGPHFRGCWVVDLVLGKE